MLDISIGCVIELIQSEEYPQWWEYSCREMSIRFGCCANWEVGSNNFEHNICLLRNDSVVGFCADWV